MILAVIAPVINRNLLYGKVSPELKRVAQRMWDRVGGDWAVN
jgi:hypothetical protein